MSKLHCKVGLSVVLGRNIGFGHAIVQQWYGVVIVTLELERLMIEGVNTATEYGTSRI